MTSRQLVLANGLRCHLHHQAGARDAAALIRVQAGSLDEPDRWPGLAHLLEHLLFCGSERFKDSERLMPWVQQRGGQVNATTQLSHSAFFFQLPAADLAEGVQRLSDMIAAPLLGQQAIRQEVAVIDAECQLLQHHAETLSEAALVDTLGGAFQRFRIGNQQSFGDNVTLLQTALRDFHQRYYHANTLELWLQGPQSLDELAHLAQHYSAINSAKNTPSYVAPTLPSGNVMLQLSDNESFWLTLMLSGEEPVLRDNVTFLSVFWQDEAPGSLLAALREAELCDTLQGQWLWQDKQHGWLALRFTGPKISAEQAQRIEHCFWQHLDAIKLCTPEHLQHYSQLAQHDFACLSPLEQLRGRALGFAPADSVPQGFSAFIAALAQKPCSRLLTQQQLDSPESAQTQGFTLRRKKGLPRSLSTSSTPAFSFYPAAHQAVLPTLSPIAMPLPRIAPRQQVETLLLRPAFYHTLSDEDAQARQTRLRPVLAALRHAGGSGSWQQKQGGWQLVLNLPVSESPALLAVHHALEALNLAPDAKPLAPAQTIVIRQLLSALPVQLIAPTSDTPWLAAWCGKHGLLHQRVSHLLSNFAPALVSSAQPPRLQRGIKPIPCTGGDQALLLFIPLPIADDRHLAALRALSLFLEPRFFQRLRVDQQIGYVVSARYQRVADVDGLMLALQSPQIPWQTLLGHCKRFLRETVADLDAIAPPTFAAWQATLREQCDIRDNAEAALQGLRQQQALPNLTPDAIASLTLPLIQQLYHRLLRERRRWRILINQS
ncbi:pyrroloquinoline quinone biosynthesis protein PqqF [Erwinia sp. S59]|uniref:pyrroloquinoline quinone biosynthesis protein PqqF n=1 Tax=Erwinia sp. S59 TaxID=2769340 RepID=UPI00190BCBE4|nr:pyrroloquinoline quinone biosynthesis protein PqqF [Erwinia sp. S59]MBK0092767.1 pyrroloquinoline quinone biosynthesis protein PqqF [Erwinia sp. S59]